MYKPLPSYAQLKEYLPIQMEKGLLDFGKKMQTYNIASNGGLFKMYSQKASMIVQDLADK
jgi:hypothetical protein